MVGRPMLRLPAPMPRQRESVRGGVAGHSAMRYDGLVHRNPRHMRQMLRRRSRVPLSHAVAHVRIAPRDLSAAKRLNGPGRKLVDYACPAASDSMRGSMPIFAIARSHFESRFASNTRASSAATCSQPLARISPSSWPGPHPAYPSASR